MDEYTLLTYLVHLRNNLLCGRQGFIGLVVWERPMFDVVKCISVYTYQ